MFLDRFEPETNMSCKPFSCLHTNAPLKAPRHDTQSYYSISIIYRRKKKNIYIYIWQYKTLFVAYLAPFRLTNSSPCGLSVFLVQDTRASRVWRSSCPRLRQTLANKAMSMWLQVCSPMCRSLPLVTNSTDATFLLRSDVTPSICLQWACGLVATPFNTAARR